MLILTEKPSVAKDFASALGCTFASGVYKNSNTTITNCIGHLFELEEPNFYGEGFPIIPNEFKYRINQKVEKQAKLVVSLLKSHKSDSILIATDADREGEIIARECLAQAGITDFSRIRRFWVSEALTPEVIKKGIENAKPLSEYDILSEQGFSRQKADWLVGMNFCRYISNAAKTKLVVGRVQTAILSAIDERCEKIKNFVSEKYFEHYGIFQPTFDGSKVSCKGIYFESDGGIWETGFKDESRSEKLKSCVGKSAKLVDSKTEKKITNPPQLYNLNALQKDAFKYFGYSADKTLKITQSLYEELKCVSYPRTPSRVMGSGNVELCQKVADELVNDKELRSQMQINLSNKRCFNDAKLEAHHALIPLKKCPESASEEQFNIYNLIYVRFSLAFLPPCEWEKQTYILDVETNRFSVVGKKILSEGFKRFPTVLAYEDRAKKLQENQSEEENTDDEQSLDNINRNSLVLSDVETKEKWTKPPAYFNEASILSFMENPKADRHVSVDVNAETKTTSDGSNKKLVGLGTPATRHTFIPKLMKHGYITQEKKNFVTTPLGKSLLAAVRSSAIKSLADISATTDWEERLDSDPKKFLGDTKDFVKEAVSQDVKIEVVRESSGIVCPMCGKEVRKGKSNWYCTGYKEGCKFVIWETVAGAKLSEKDVAALCLGKKTGIKHCISKAGKSFDCRFVLDEEKKIKFVFEEK